MADGQQDNDKRARILALIKEEEKINNGQGVPRSKIGNRLGISYYYIDPILNAMEKEGILKKTVKGVNEKFKYYNIIKKRG